MGAPVMGGEVRGPAITGARALGVGSGRAGLPAALGHHCCWLGAAGLDVSHRHLLLLLLLRRRSQPPPTPCLRPALPAARPARQDHVGGEVCGGGAPHHRGGQGGARAVSERERVWQGAGARELGSGWACLTASCACLPDGGLWRWRRRPLLHSSCRAPLPWPAPHACPARSALAQHRRLGPSSAADVTDALAAAAAAAAQRAQQQRINFHVGVLHYTPSSEPFPMLGDAVEVRRRCLALRGWHAAHPRMRAHPRVASSAAAAGAVLSCLRSHSTPLPPLRHARSTTPPPSTSTTTPRRWPTGSASCRRAPPPCLLLSAARRSSMLPGTLLSC